jgi:hypothetical protein
MGVESGKRATADISQLEKALEASPDIVDKLSSLVREKLDAKVKATGKTD